MLPASEVKEEKRVRTKLAQLLIPNHHQVKPFIPQSLIYLDDPYPENAKASEKHVLVPSLASPPLTNS